MLFRSMGLAEFVAHIVEKDSNAYLRVDYKDENFKTCTVFFRPCDDLKKMVKAFEKYRKNKLVKE